MRPKPSKDFYCRITVIDRPLHKPKSTILLLIIVTGILLTFPRDTLPQGLYFTTEPVWSSGQANRTSSVAFGDIDGDGDLDLVCGNYTSSGNNTLYLNDGGILSTTPDWSSGPANWTNDLALGDVDGDGDLDLVCGNGFEGNTLYLNDNGVFSTVPDWSPGPPNLASCMVLGDVDDDGDLDLVCGRTGGNTLYLNDGGVFSTTPDWLSGPENTTSRVALGDVDGDGDLDLVCGNATTPGQANSMYLNEGGVFSTIPDWLSGLTNTTNDIALGDVDGDGDLDLVCGNGFSSGASNTLYLNEGGMFSTTPDWSSGPTNWTLSVVLGDVDNDGDLDLACGNGGDLHTLYMNGGGVLSGTPVWSSTPVSATQDVAIALGDVDGDGDLDLISGKNQTNSLYRNEGGIFSTMPAWASTPMFQTLTVALDDVDGDNDLDLVCGGETNTLYLNERSDSVFSSIPAWSSGPQQATWGIALGDIDGDRDPDLVCGNVLQSNTLYWNQGGAFSTTPVWFSAPAHGTSSVALADIDGDGDLDLTCGNEGQSNTLYWNEGGLFLTTPSWSSGPANYTRGIAAGDVDGDGDLDVVCGNWSFGEHNTLYLNEGDGFSTTPIWSAEPYNRTFDVALGDIDGDGALDLVCGNWSESNLLYRGDGGMFSTTPVWSSGPGNPTYSVALGDVDWDGDLDLVCGNEAQANTLYLGEAGVFSILPDWSSGLSNQTRSIALADVDEDGDLDIVCGNGSAAGQSNTLYLGKKVPLFKGDASAPTNHLPNNGSYLRAVNVARVSANLHRVVLTAFDVESDPVWIVPEYQFEGDPKWNPADFVWQNGGVDPLPTSPSGITHSLDWDVTRVPFDHRDVILRLRTVSVPMRVSLIQHVASYSETVGRVIPSRPEINKSKSSLSFRTITVGDTDRLKVAIANSGNALLSVSDIELPSTEMALTQPAAFDLTPGSVDTVTVILAPRRETDIAGEMLIVSNDPITPVDSIRIITDIRALEFTSKLLGDPEGIPLGQAVTVEVTPYPQVHIEKGYLYYRAAGLSDSFQDSIQLDASVDEFIATIPGGAVTEAGLEWYVRVENNGVPAFYPPGAPELVEYQTVKAPEAITTNPVPNMGSEFLEGRDITVQVSVPVGASFDEGRLYYRRGGKSVYHSVDIQPGDPLPFAVIPGAITGARGLEYWVKVKTLTKVLRDPPGAPHVSPRTIRLTVLDLAEKRSHAAGRYRRSRSRSRWRGQLPGRLPMTSAVRTTLNGGCMAMIWISRFMSNSPTISSRRSSRAEDTG